MTFHIMLIPQYLLFLNLGWLDTLLPLIVPNLFGKAFLIFILRQFLLTLPRASWTRRPRSTAPTYGRS